MMGPSLIISGSGGGSGVDGKSVELQVTATHIQWRQTGGVWADLIALSELAGADGNDGTNGIDGKNIELQKTATAIQWRETGGIWADLVTLTELTGTDGSDGLSAYEIAVNSGFVGTESEWISSLNGVDGSDGLSAYQIAVNNGFVGTETEWNSRNVLLEANGDLNLDDPATIRTFKIYAGKPSFDANDNYVSSRGGFFIGNELGGARLQQEGFKGDYDENSIVMYGTINPRPVRLAICPAGNPEDMPGEDTTSLALQHQNGGGQEQRFVIISKKAGEYRLASVATGIGQHFPITFSTSNYINARFGIAGQDTLTITNEPLGIENHKNTTLKIAQPATSDYMRMFGRTDGRFGIEYLGTSASQSWRINTIGMSIGGVDPAARSHVLNNDTSLNSLLIQNTNGAFASTSIQVDNVRVSNSGYSHFKARSNTSGTANTQFDIRGDGHAFADGAWNAGGADYAEYFEWLDGNPDDEDRVGHTVVLDNDKIRLATTGETPFGVISGMPSVVGNTAWNSWSGKFMRDDFGRVLKDEDGAEILNPDFDPDLEYVAREDRQEWSPVGLMGRLRIRKGQPVNPTWIKLKDISDTVEEWLIK